MLKRYEYIFKQIIFLLCGLNTLLDISLGQSYEDEGCYNLCHEDEVATIYESSVCDKTFMTVYCYNCPILLLVIVSFFLLFLPHLWSKFLYVCIKKYNISDSLMSMISGILWVVFNLFPVDNGD